MRNSVNLIRISNRAVTRPTLVQALAVALASVAAMPASVRAQNVLDVAPDQTVAIPGDYPSSYTVDGVTVRSGVLILRDGARLTNKGVAEGSGPGRIIIGGVGTVWSQQGEMSLYLRDRGGPALTIENGGALEAGAGLALFTPPTGAGGVVVAGAGSRLSVKDGLTMLMGKLEVSDGAVVEVGKSARFGTRSGRPPTYFPVDIHLSGQGTRLSAGESMFVERGSIVTVADGAALSAPRIDLSGRLNIGGWVGEVYVPYSTNTRYLVDPPRASGRVDADVVFAGGEITFNHTDSNYVFSGRMSGWGTLAVMHGGTRLTGDSSGFTFGSTKVSYRGSLWVDGKLGGNVAVSGGGLLGGNGVVGGNATIDAGGTLSPGNSIGRLSVGGDLTFNPASTFRVELTPQADSDQVSVGGKLILNGGAVAWSSNSAAFKPFTEYVLISAQGGVSGQFAEIIGDNYPFLDVKLGYNPQSVTLKLIRNDVGFSERGETANQRAAAAAAESGGAGSPLWNTIVQLDAARARQTFDLLSGEIHASTQAALIDGASEVRDGVLSHLRGNDKDGGSSVWAQATGQRGRIDGDGNAAKLDRNGSGLLIGGDTSLGDHWRLGGMLGAGRSHNDVDSRRSRSESDDRHYGLYADARWERARVRLGAIRSQYEVETRRGLDTADYPGQLTSKYDADSTQLFGEFGYAFGVGGFELEPFLGVAQVKLSVDAFAESGNAAAVRGESEDPTVRYSTLGLRAATSSGGDSRWRFDGLLGWRRASGDIEPVSHLAFAAGTPFVVAGLPIARNSAVVEASVGAQLSERTSLSLGYAGQFASDVSDHGASAKLTVTF
ncbi:autotransporter outer membrane beta-barrel domain-containing protein [Pseudomonas sp. CGJS7]|uniref:autotransporter outer membrane beta-barrel domain-containing protein n=1 Tax=Pseudomonas sp. CGJS7 TaxID=3109348 RepID=UPI00300922D7